MRISNISQYLGGADNVVARSMLRGEQIIYNINYTTGIDKDIVDISKFTLEAEAEFYTATVNVTSRSATITSLSNIENKGNRDLPVTITDADAGVAQLVVPFDLIEAGEAGTINSINEVVISAIYLTVDDGGNPASINRHRILLIIRPAP